MKYAELISFNPIEDVIQLKTADDSRLARQYVQSYIMSDAMAESLQVPVIDQLQMDEVVNNLGVLIVGNYGTGKSHLMSVISAVAADAENLQYLQNRKFAEHMKPVAGKFEILRIEIGGVTMSLREILCGFIEDDFAARGIDFTVPDFSTVKDNKKLLQDVMTAFASKYPGKGYLLVVDEFLSYLTSRDEKQIVLDLEFLRALGEMCSKSRLRVIFGVQEKIFDNPRFSFVADTLKHVSDRFTQLIITKEDTAYVVSERILKKTPEQKARIRQHLEQFTSLYGGMASRLEEFVDLFPIHPAYIDVFNRLYLIENRHVLKNISVAIRNVFGQDVPADAPGIISFDDYWPAIKSNGLLKTDPTIGRVVSASGQLEEIINRGFAKAAYKPMAMRIIYALSVHRLTTNGLDVQFGLTAENLKDDLCLYLPMPEQDSEFLLGAVNAALREIMTTVSGQFIIHNESNNQYYIDVDKVIDYDEKIRQKASIMAESDLNRYFYDLIYSCMEWSQREYVTGFKIYQYDLDWDSHRIFREGYLFLGLPGERSTAQPERDFYIHFLPPYDAAGTTLQHLPDEVYFCFRSSPDFRTELGLFAAAQSLATLSEGKDRDAYTAKAQEHRKKLVRYLSTQKNTCFDVLYQHQKRQLIEILKGRYNADLNFKDTIDLAASILLDAYFTEKYPGLPVMQTKITRSNQAELARAAIEHFAGRKTRQSTAILQSFGVLDGEKIRPENSRYAQYYLNLVKQLPPQGVLNYSDLFDMDESGEAWDKKFHISYLFTPVIFLSLVHAGAAVITLIGNKTITASNLDQLASAKFNTAELYTFKYLSRPAEASLAELKQLFEGLGLNPALLNAQKDREKAVEQLLEKAKKLSSRAVYAKPKLAADFTLWGEPLANAQEISAMRAACDAVLNEFTNYPAKYNTPAKLNNFTLSSGQIADLLQQIRLMGRIEQLTYFKSGCASIVSYLASLEGLDLGTDFKEKLDAGKSRFRELRDSVMDGTSGEAAAQQVVSVLTPVKAAWIDIYFEAHKKKRLGIEDARRRGKLQESSELAKLKKLRSITILSSAKLSQWETDLAGLKVCYELTTAELQHSTFCPHCHFSLQAQEKNVYGQLDNLADRLEKLTAEWTQALLNTVTDPVLADQKQFLTQEQQRAIDAFAENGTLPARVDDIFVNAIKALLQGFEPVVISSEQLLAQLEALPPMDTAAFNQKLQAILQSYTKGKDPDRVRIIVKRQEEG